MAGSGSINLFLDEISHGSFPPQQLEKLWDEIGKSEQERHAVLIRIKQECFDAYEREIDASTIFGDIFRQTLAESEREQDRHAVLLWIKQKFFDAYTREIDATTISRDKLRQTLAESERELARLISALGEKTNPEKSSGTINERVQVITAAIEELKKKKKERIEDFRQITSEIESICCEFAGKLKSDENVYAPNVESYDLSLSRIFRRHLNDLHKIKCERQQMVFDKTRKIQALCIVLGIDFLSIITAIDPDLKSISNDTLFELDKTIDSLKKLKKEKQKKEKQKTMGMFIASRMAGENGYVIVGNGAVAFDMEYARWLDEHQRHMSDLRSALNSQLRDDDLRVLVDAIMMHYDELFRIKSVGSKSDVFHIISGMWTTPAERFFMWIGGFKSSELLKLVLAKQLEPLTDHQLMGICNLQQSSQQAEDALSQGMEALKQSLAETLASACLGPSASSNNVANYMGQMAIPISKLGTLENFLRQADLLRQETLRQMHQILTTRQAARALVVISDYFAGLRALSSLWLARPRE